MIESIDKDKTIDTIREPDKKKLSEEERKGMVVYICNSCGSEIAAVQTLTATICPFCGSPVVVGGQFDSGERPDRVIPFQIDKKVARENYIEFVSGRKLLPKIFSDEKMIEDLKGVYIPVWENEKKNEIIRKIDGFNLEESVEFDSHQLPGYYLRKYESTGDGICTLYPVWLLSIKWEEETYSFVMNGQNGKYTGKLPIDKKKFWTMYSTIAAAIAVITFVLLMIIS